MHKQSLVSTFKMRVSCFSLFHIRANWISFGSGLLVWQKEQVVIVRYFSMIQNKGWKANVQLLEVGCRGFVAISTSRILQEMVVVGRPARQRSKTSPELLKMAVSGSVWRERPLPGRSSELMVSRGWGHNTGHHCWTIWRCPGPISETSRKEGD